LLPCQARSPMLLSCKAETSFRHLDRRVETVNATALY
jgi:hypothetical protein